MVAVGDAQGARSILWEFDGLYGGCGGGSRSSTGSMVAVGEAQGARRALWLLWGRLMELDRFYGSLTGSMVALGRLKELDLFSGIVSVGA